MPRILPLLCCVVLACHETSPPPLATAPLSTGQGGLVPNAPLVPPSSSQPVTWLAALGQVLSQDMLPYFYARGERQPLTVMPDHFVLVLPHEVSPRATLLANLLERRIAAGLEPVWRLDDVWSTLVVFESTRSALETALGPELSSHLQPVYRDLGHIIVVPSDRLFVRFKPGLEGDPATAIGHGLGGQPLTVMPDGSVVLRVAGDVLTAASRLHETGLVVYAEPDLGRPYETREAASDPFYPNQWHLHGGGPAHEDADVDIERAWDSTRGSPDVVIAIIDTGVDPDHADLDHCKQVAGYDAVFDRPGGADTGGHGTACAGVAAARGDNGTGVVGACPSCRIMPIRIGLGRDSLDLARSPTAPGFDGIVYDSHIARALFTAVEQGADILSNSWGPTLTSGPRVLSSIGAAALDHALTEGRGGKGALVLFAAGNEDAPVELDGWASHPGVMAIAASNDQAVRAGYSNFGAAISVAAPSSGIPVLDGAKTSGIWTTDRSGGPGYNPGLGYRTAGDSRGDYSARFGGTSSATPLVAGIAGLVLSVDGDLTASAIKSLLEATAVPIDPDGGAYDSEGKSVFYGHGRVDAAAAVARALAERGDAAVGEACGAGCGECISEPIQGSYCSAACVDDGTCGPGYRCEGRCVREFLCAQPPELCNELNGPNGVDDDSDGLTDEGCTAAGCGNTTEAGHCEGASAVFCEAGAVVAIDCGALGGGCVIDPALGVARCDLCPADPADGAMGRCHDQAAVHCTYLEVFGVRSLGGVSIEVCPEACVETDGAATCDCLEPALDQCVGDKHVFCDYRSASEARIACADGCDTESSTAACHCEHEGLRCEGNRLSACDVRGDSVTFECPGGCGTVGFTDDCLCADGAPAAGACTSQGDVHACVAGEPRVFDCPESCVESDGVQPARCACDGVDETGVCDGDVAVNCHHGYVVRTRCQGGCGVLLSADGENQAAGCLCEGMDQPVECDGGSIRICTLGGTVVSVPCGVLFEGTDVCVPVSDPGPDEAPVDCIASGPAGPDDVDDVADGVDEGDEGPVEPVEEVTVEDDHLAEADPDQDANTNDGCAGGGGPGSVALWVLVATLACRRSRPALA